MMKTTTGKVLPKINSAMPAIFMAIPPMKYIEPLTATRELESAPLNWTRHHMVVWKGIKRPIRPSKVGLPETLVNIRTILWLIKIRTQPP